MKESTKVHLKVTAILICLLFFLFLCAVFPYLGIALLLVAGVGLMYLAIYAAVS